MSFRSSVLSLSPSIYWILDSLDGATDISGNSRNGTLVGVSLGDNNSSPVDSCANSTSFNGSSKTISAVTYAPFVNGTTRSIGVWVWRTSLSNRDGILGSAGGAGGYTFIEAGLGSGASNNDDIEFSPDWGTTNFVWTHGWPGAAQWVFLGWTYNETTDVSEAYINGTTLGTVTHTTAYANTTNNIQIGSWADTVYLNGNLSNFFMVEGLVTAAQWLSLYQSSRAPGLLKLNRDKFPKTQLRT